MNQYWKDNWDGWPLHSAIAFVLMLPVVSNSYPWVMFLINLVFWPMREAWQHDGVANIWTRHRITEWGAPILVAALMFAGSFLW